MRPIQDRLLHNIQVQRDSHEISLTADICLFGFRENRLRILLLKRTVGTLTDSWLLPGGVMEADETIEQCASKVLRYLIGIEDVHMTQVKVYSHLDRHPVKRVATLSFYALIQPENHPMSQQMSVTEIRWFDLENLPPNIGFDHLQIIRDAHRLLKRNLKSDLIFGELLPETFTLNELQTLYESILEETLDRRNFRKKILNMDILTHTGEIKKGIKGGPYLFRKKAVQ